MKNKKKTKYRKIIRWEKKIKWEEILGGIAFCIGSIFVLALLFNENKTVTLLAFVVTLLWCKGLKLLLEGIGEGRKKYYTKIK